jgi:hypothetical protein
MTARRGVHERIYRALLRCYPAGFRAQFADEMVQLFTDQLRTAGATRTWLRTLGELPLTAASEHLRTGRAVARSLGPPPARSSRVLGLIGIIGGVMLVAFLIPNVAWGATLFNLRLVFFNAGAIAIAVAVHRRQAARGRLLSLAASVPTILANGGYFVMVLVFVGRPQPPEPDPEFRPLLFVAAVALWLADAAFGLVALRLGGVSRWGALALGIGSVLALTGVSGLGFTAGPWASMIEPLTILGIVLVGFGWILLGIDVATRRHPSAASRGREALG